MTALVDSAGTVGGMLHVVPYLILKKETFCSTFEPTVWVNNKLTVLGFPIMRGVEAEGAQLPAWDGKRKIQALGVQCMRWLLKALKTLCLIVDPKSITLI